MYNVGNEDAFPPQVFTFGFCAYLRKSIQGYNRLFQALTILIMYSCVCAKPPQSCPTLIPWTIAQQAPCPLYSSGKNPGVGCHLLLQGIFPSQGWNIGLQHCRQMLYHLSQSTDITLPKGPYSQSYGFSSSYVQM